MKKLRVLVLISGRGSNLEALFRAEESGKENFQIIGALSDKATAPGLEFARKRQVQTVVIERKAKEQSKQEFNSKLLKAAINLNPDLVVLAGYMRVIPPEFIREFQGRIINIHPSLLPSFRGLHAQTQAILAGVKFSGCTVHYVVEDVDAGPIIAQAVVPVLPDDSPDTLASRILIQEHKILPAVVRSIAYSEISAHSGETSPPELEHPEADDFLISVQDNIKH